MPLTCPFKFSIATRAQLVKHARDLNASIRMRIAPIAGGHQEAAILEAERVQFIPMVMTIAQNKANFKREFTQKKRSLIAISDIGWGHLSGQGNPNGSDRRNQMQFPAIDESMPA